MKSSMRQICRGIAISTVVSVANTMRGSRSAYRLGGWGHFAKAVSVAPKQDYR